MSRLIYEDAVIKAIDKHTKDSSEIILDNDITCILEEVPTAFDLEKVLERLEKKIKPLYNANWNAAIEEAIEIVKEDLL